MESWSDWEREEFSREIREKNSEYGFVLIDKIAGLAPDDPQIVEAVASHQNIAIMGRSFGTLISESNARELTAIRIDAVTASVSPDRSHEVAVAFMKRLAAVLGAVFVDVDPPHEPIGAQAMSHVPASLFFFMYTMAWVRRPVVRDDN